MKHILLTLIAATTLFACSKDGKEILTTLNPEYIKTSIQGTVLDEHQQPVAGSTVVIGKYTIKTNARGVFRLDSIDVDTKASVVKVSKSGYFNGFRTFIPSKDILSFVQLQLITSNEAGKFSAANGGTVTVPNGGSITFDAGSVNTTGNVHVSAYYINPALPELPNVMPGDLRGITATGAERGLQSFGMMAVELTDDAGLKLQLSKPATLKMPIPAAMRTTAPATIPLWSFNDANGLWKEEGTATKQDTNYICTVSHFSFWNCDAPYPQVSFQAVIKAANGNPMFDVQVDLKVVNEQYRAYGRSDSTGKVYGNIPVGKSLEMSIINRCNTVVYTKVIGPFTQDTDLGAITVSLPYGGNAVISGKALNCTGQPVMNGRANIIFQDNFYSAKINNGNFTFNLDRCDISSAEVSLTVKDDDESMESNVSKFNITDGTYNIGSINSCVISTAQYFNITVDGKTYATEPADTLLIFTSRVDQKDNILFAATHDWSFTTYSTGTTTGTFHLSNVSFSVGRDNYTEDSSSIINNKMIFTEYDKYATGTFSTKMIKATTSNAVNVSGSFRLKIQ